MTLPQITSGRDSVALVATGAMTSHGPDDIASTPRPRGVSGAVRHHPTTPDVSRRQRPAINVHRANSRQSPRLARSQRRAATPRSEVSDGALQTALLLRGAALARLRKTALR